MAASHAAMCPSSLLFTILLLSSSAPTGAVHSIESSEVSVTPMVRRDNHTSAHEGSELAAELAQKAGATFFAEHGGVYYVVFGPLLVLTLALAWLTRPKVVIGEAVPAEFYVCRRRYLCVWALAISADWLQGPYVYALYASYGYSSSDIAKLFVAGFGASMVFGTFVGSVADAWGRKFCAMVFCFLYAISCLTKHFNIFGVLALGRITGGMSTSLLFSTFECWMVAEHRQKKGFSEALLRYMFGLMFSVQYMVAIVSGVLAQGVASAFPLTGGLGGFSSLYYGGYTGPFDLSFLVLVVTAPLIYYTWDENYGQQRVLPGKSQLRESLTSAGKALSSSWHVAILGIVISCFEGSMFSFVFHWTPALASETVTPPHGLIFSAFMMACMCGSCFFALLDPATSPTKVLTMSCVAGALALGVVMVNVGDDAALPIVFFAFLAFEACVGIYFPAMGALKSQVVPEQARAGVYTLYRVPLNAVVCGLILSNISLQSSFGFCSILLIMACLCLALSPREGVSQKASISETVAIVEKK